MSDPTERFAACHEFTSPALNRTIQLISIAIYFVLAAFAFWRHHHLIVKWNKVLLVSWLIEVTIDLFPNYAAFYSVRIIGQVFNTVNACLFYYMILRFRALTIYMDKGNATEEDVKRQL